MTLPTASQRGANWLIGLMNDDGSIRGATSINDYYKTVFGLCCAGRGIEADRMLDYIAHRFVREDGDLDGAGCEWFKVFPIYPHAWVLMAALVRGRLDMVHRLSSFLITFHDEQTGGFYTTPEQRESLGQQDMMTTGLVAIALLWAGRTEVTQRTALWMRQLWQAQPDPVQKLYFIWNHRDGLVQNLPDRDAKEYVVDATRDAQRYYQFGIPCAFLTQFAATTGENKWHELARDYLHISRHYYHDVYQRPQSGKIGWAAAWRYRILHDPVGLSIVRQVHDNLTAAQQPQGSWSALSVYQPQSTETHTLPVDAPGIDLTAEFVAHLCWMESALDNAGIPPG